MTKKDAIKKMIVETFNDQVDFGGKENWAFLKEINFKMQPKTEHYNN